MAAEGEKAGEVDRVVGPATEYSTVHAAVAMVETEAEEDPVEAQETGAKAVTAQTF